jgi:hypothetical protein
MMRVAAYQARFLSTGSLEILGRIRLYVVTDPAGRTVGPSGLLTQELINPGAVLEFKYTGAGT